MNYTFRTHGVCAQFIEFDLTDGIVRDVVFYSGCNGNLKAIGKLVEGKPATELIALLKGNLCGNKGTSCADQLAIALEDALRETSAAKA